MRRMPSLTVYNGRLFAVPGSCRGVPDANPPHELGRVYSMMAGACCSYDRDIGAGWKHIAAVRDEDVAALYVNGERVAESPRFRQDYFDVSNSQPLLVGNGALDYFSGVMDELRVYNRGLTEQEIKSLAQMPAD
jgi:hypothetical protein